MVPARTRPTRPDQLVPFEAVGIVMPGSTRLPHRAEDEPFVPVPVIARIPIATLFLRRHAERLIDVGSSVRPSYCELAAPDDHAGLRNDLEAELPQDAEAT